MRYKLTNRIGTDSGIVLAGITAILYTWGTANYHGFILTLQLNSDVMERSFHQVIYSGFLISYQYALAILLFFVIFRYTFSHIFIAGIEEYKSKSNFARNRIIKIKRKIFPEVEHSTLTKKEFSKSKNSLKIFTIGLAYLFSLSHFESKGADEANEIIKAHLSGKNIPSQIITTIISGESKKLRFLGCGEKSCAGIEEKSNLIFYFQSTSQYSFPYRLNKNMDIP